MRIAVASDHAGYRYKTAVAEHLRRRGHQVVDLGTDSELSVDYPDFITPAALAVAHGECDRAAVFGGSGNGEAMAANRVTGVRCAVVWSEETARLARAHNDANAIAIGQRLLTLDQVLAFVDVWLETPFEGGRHVRRIEKLDRPAGSAGAQSSLGTTEADTSDTTRIEAWLDAYRHAWTTDDPDEVAGLFTEDIMYSAEPYAEPLRGREAVVAFWLGEQESGIPWESEPTVVARDGDLYVVRAVTTYPEGTRGGEGREVYHNLWLVRLDDDGRAREFAEYYMLAP